MAARKALSELTPEEVSELVSELGEAPYRAGQLLKRAWRNPVRSFDEMTELPAGFRKQLAERLDLRALRSVETVSSADGLTEKRLHRTRDGNLIESVWIRAGKRLTVCLSTQVGCRYGCAFCASGGMGLARSLSAVEIAEQALITNSASAHHGGPTHVVFMGIGEPLDNYDEALKAVRILNAPGGLRIGARRMTISTIGIPGGIRRLAREGLQVKLALSLHAPDEGTRRELLPKAPAPVKDVLAAAAEYSKLTKRIVTFEYVLIEGVNASPGQARSLAALARALKAKVNLIPLNPVEGTGLSAPSALAVREFLKVLSSSGVRATLRRERGADVNAACGQLRWGRRR